MQLGVLFGSQLLGGGFFMRLAVTGASIAGSLLLKDKSAKNPQKLNDLRVSSSSYGRGIAIVYGTMRVSGNMFWATDFREDHYYISSKGKRLSGSKGKKKEAKGQAQEVYEYYANFAMGLCAGPVAAVLKVWADNNLIYNKTNPSDDDIVSPGFSQNQGNSKQGRKASGQKGKGGNSGKGFSFRLYNGNEEQLPDPFMASKTTAHKTPAYRGLCYLMFEDFPLKDFGSRIPTITAEISVTAKRRPMFEIIENMEPKTGLSQKFQGSAMWDQVRNRLYHRGRTDDFYFIRVFDMSQGREIDRIPMSSFQGDWIGLTHLGDLVFNGRTQNYSPLLFYDPDTRALKRKWGGSGILSPDPYGNSDGHSDGIFISDLALPIGGIDEYGKPTGYTAVHGWEGVHIFDSNYNYLRFVSYNNRMVTTMFPGLPGTTTASGHGADVFMVTSPNYQANGKIYAFSGNPSRSVDGVELVLDWPLPEMGAEGFGGIDWAGVVMGGQALGVIAWADGLGAWALKIDYKSGAVLWKKQIDPNPSRGAGSSFTTWPTTGSDSFSWIAYDTIYTVNWAEESATSYESAHTSQDGDRVWIPSTKVKQYYLAELEAILYFTEDPNINNGEGNWVIVYLNKHDRNKVYLSDIVTDVAHRCRIPYDRINTTRMTADEEVMGYMIENPTPGRSVLEELSDAFQFDAVESDNVLKFVSRGKSPILTIPQEDLGVVETDFGGENEFYVETRMQELDLPERCVVEFIDPDQKYETGNEGYKRPAKPIPVMGSADRLDVTLNMAMQPLYAKTLAKRIIYAAWGERTSHEYTLPRDYLRLDPSDVINVALDNGVTFEDRLTDLQIGADLSIKATTVSQIADNYSLTTTVTDPGGVISEPYQPVPNSRPAVFDIPYLFDSDSQINPTKYEFYWATKAFGSGYRGGSLNSSVSDDDAVEVEGFTTVDALWGYVVGLVPPPPSGITEITDTETVIELAPGFDYNDPDVRHTWASIDDSEWPSTENMVIIDDEVILFKDVEELENGHVLISTLIRGYKGTGLAAFNHPTNPNDTAPEFVLVNELAVVDADHPVTEIGKQHQYMINSGSDLPNWITAVNKTTTAATRKPWQAGGIKRSNLGNGDVSVSFFRATRFGGELKNGTDAVPRNESIEKYEVYWLNEPYDKETWSPDNDALFWHKTELTDSSVASVTSSELAAAGLSNKSDIYLVIYQMSDQVGRGFPRYITLPYSKFGL